MDNDTSILVRLPVDLKAQIEAAATKNRRSVNAQVRYWIECALASEAPTAEPAPLFAGGGNGQ